FASINRRAPRASFAAQFAVSFAVTDRTLRVTPVFGGSAVLALTHHDLVLLWFGHHHSARCFPLIFAIAARCTFQRHDFHADHFFRPSERVSLGLLLASSSILRYFSFVAASNFFFTGDRSITKD